jgi:hypothetical protein
MIRHPPVLFHPPRDPSSTESESGTDSESEVDSDLEPEDDLAKWEIQDEKIEPNKMEPELEPEIDLSEPEGSDEDLEPKAFNHEMFEPEDSKDEIEPPPTPLTRDIVSLIEDDDSDREVKTQGRKHRINLIWEDREAARREKGKEKIESSSSGRLWNFDFADGRGIYFSKNTGGWLNEYAGLVAIIRTGDLFVLAFCEPCNGVRARHE